MAKQKDIIIKVRNIERYYGRKNTIVKALDGIDLDIYRGEYISIMGPSGSGKSTLFNMIGGLDTPTGGDVSFEDYRLSELDSAQLAWFRCNQIGFIFQSFNLIESLTALKNVAMPRIFGGISRARAEQDAAETLKMVGLGHRLTHLPAEVSGGQQQRIAIARALVNKPSIVLADEPTGNLDLKTGEDIIKLLDQVKKKFGVTVITATHDMKMLSKSDRVVWMEDGKIKRIAQRGEIDIEVGTIDGKA